jgi:hypothetical protein
MSDIKYPDIEVQLTGEDGNAMMIIGRVCNALRRAKIPDVEIDLFTYGAMDGDYSNVLTTAMRWVSVS